MVINANVPSIRCWTVSEICDWFSINSPMISEEEIMTTFEDDPEMIYSWIEEVENAKSKAFVYNYR